MPAYKFGDAEAPFEHLTGDYPFEIQSVEFGLQAGQGKTSGSDKMELKIMFFRDATFTQKAAQWTETLIFHSSTAWKIDTFVKSANLLINGAAPAKDQNIEFTEEMLVGLRGWATCKPEPSQSDKTKIYNRVQVWLTSKGKIAKRVVQKIEDTDEFD